MTSRLMTFALAGTTALGLSAGTMTTAQAAPLPALSGVQVGGANATVEHVGWRRGYYGGGYGRGYGYRGYGYRRGNVGGALAAGAALGLIGGALAASAAPRYGYYDGGYYGAGYPAYGYSYPAYGYAPAGYGYGYGYPGYGW